MEEFDEQIEKKSTLVVFIKNVNCLTCEEDRWTVAKLYYNFMLRRDVRISLDCYDQFYVLEAESGDLPAFDKEFEIKDDYEHPQFLLFKDGSRTPYRHDSADDLVE